MSILFFFNCKLANAEQNRTLLYHSYLFQVGLRSADQILEYNGVDLRQATAEQAAYELAQPAEKVSILVQYNPESKILQSVI